MPSLLLLLANPPPDAEGRTLISGARDNTIRLWNSSTCATIREIFDRKQGVNGKHRADVRRACLLPASNPQQQRQLLTASMDGTVRAWLLAADDAGAAGGSSQPAASAAKPPATSDADLLLLGGGVAIDESGSAGGVTAAPRHRGGAAAVSLDSLDVGAGWDDTTKALLLEILAGKAAVDVTVSEAGNDLCLSSMSFFDREVGVSSLALNPNPARPIVAVSSSAHSLALLSLRMDTLPWLVRQAEGTLPSGILPQGTDLSPLTLVQTFAGHASAVTGVALLADEATLVSASTDSRVSVYDVASVDRRLSFAFGTSALCVALAPSEGGGKSQFVFVGGADCVLFLLASTSCTANPLPPPPPLSASQDVIRAYSTNPADYAAVTAAYAALPVPQPVARHDFEAARYVGHAGRVETIAIHPNGRVMASGGRDWSVLLWSLVRPVPTLAVRSARVG